MFALLVGVSGRSPSAAKLARAGAAKTSGRAELATGAWAMSDAYINRTATKSCGEPVQAWCVYRLDTGLVKEMARFFTDMRRCGLNRCCRSAVEAQCIRGSRRNTTCMTARLEA